MVVANGAEGEPASAKDRYLLTVAPHLVLDGVQVAAAATGADEAFVYAPADLLRGSLGIAVSERADPVRVQAVVAPDAFLSGEESAAVAAVHGRRAVPVTTPPRVYERGVRGRPTLVQNVETLAHLGLIARFGPRWFRSAGTAEEPGTRLVTVSGAVGRPGVYEVAGGSALTDVLTAAGGPAGALTALLVGGYHGGWVPYGAVGSHLRMTRAALAPYDAAPGAGVVLALAGSVCGLRAGADIAGYLAGQGARQCGPCRNGLPALAGTLRELAYGQPRGSLVSDVERLSALVADRGACHQPPGRDGTPDPEHAAHLRRRGRAAPHGPLLGRRHVGAEGAGGMTERLVVDWIACDGRGLCVELLPELLAADDWGYPVSRLAEASPAVPPELRRHAARAVRECPMLALRLLPSP